MHTFLTRLDEELRKIDQRRPWLSKMTDIPLSTINSWFSKDVLPKVDDAYKISELLKVTLDYLMTGKNNMIGDNAVLNNIIGFLQDQDVDGLRNIESALTMFNYLNATQIGNKEPAFMLDSVFTVTWVNDRFVEIFGDESRFVGSQLSHVYKSVYHKSLPDNTGLVEESLIPVQNNMILIPIVKISRDVTKPLGYAGIISNVADDESFMDTNIILKLVEVTLNKEYHSVNHIKRIRGYTRILTDELIHEPSYPEADEAYMEDVNFYAPMHDIGKIGIPDDILNKHGKLKKWERQIVKEHTINGAYILSAYKNAVGKMIALQHHEKWDGSGYPYGLAGNMISLGARIASICVIYDTLRSHRNYRGQFSHKEALKIIAKGKGLFFEPGLVDCFTDNESKIDSVYSVDADKPEKQG